MSSPPRSLTLEAQRENPTSVLNLRRWIKSSFIGPEVPDDVVEQHLTAKISQSRDDERKFLLRLRLNYGLFKNAQGSAIVSFKAGYSRKMLIIAVLKVTGSNHKLLY